MLAAGIAGRRELMRLMLWFGERDGMLRVLLSERLGFEACEGVWMSSAGMRMSYCRNHRR